MISAKDASKLANSALKRKRSSFARLAQYVEKKIEVFAEGGDKFVEVDLNRAMCETDSNDLLQFTPERELAMMLRDAGYDVEVITFSNMLGNNNGIAATLKIYWPDSKENGEKGTITNTERYA